MSNKKVFYPSCESRPMTAQEFWEWWERELLRPEVQQLLRESCPRLCCRSNYHVKEEDKDVADR